MHGAQERKYAARRAKAMPRHVRACKRIYTYYYAIFNYCVGASGVPASVLNIVGNQPLCTGVCTQRTLAPPCVFRPTTTTTSPSRAVNKLYKQLHFVVFMLPSYFMQFMGEPRKGGGNPRLHCNVSTISRLVNSKITYVPLPVGNL